MADGSGLAQWLREYLDSKALDRDWFFPEDLAKQVLHQLAEPTPVMLQAMVPILIHADPEQDPEDIAREAWREGIKAALQGAG